MEPDPADAWGDDLEHGFGVHLTVAERRKADEEHREKIEGEAIAALTMLLGIECYAETILIAIRDGKIPRVTINY